jgi:hypothetical protein
VGDFYKYHGTGVHLTYVTFLVSYLYNKVPEQMWGRQYRTLMDTDIMLVSENKQALLEYFSVPKVTQPKVE